MANPSRYRYIKFYGGRILQSREVSELQRIQEGLDATGTNRVAYDLDAIYREGASLNIRASISGGSIALNAAGSDSNLYVFVRGRWEVLQPSEIQNPLTLNGSGNTNVYLNWALRQVTSSEDTTLIDSATGEPTADMGELDISVSLTDTSGVALASNQIEKNTHPIILFTFTSFGTVVPIDNVTPQALATSEHGGLVKLTTSSSGGTAVSTDDSRMTDPRNPITGSVVDASVRTPVQVSGQTNTDGTPKYNLTSDVGGISAAKIIHLPGTQLVSDAIQWLKGQVTSAMSQLTNHIGIRLGLANTHPMPTPADVGAAPASHVGLPLGLPASHPATVSTNSGGFSLNRDSSVPGSANDPAYGVFNSGTNIASLNHNGDIYSAQAQNVSANPLAPATTTGPLGLMSVIAHVLSEHVNQTSHANPHGLVAGDIGAPTQGYVDGAVGAVLAAANNYTNVMVPGLSVSTTSVFGGTFVIFRFAPNNNNAIEIAFGSGSLSSGSDIPTPNGNFDYSNFLGTVSPGAAGQTSRTINVIHCSLNGPTINYTVNDNNNFTISGTANWMAIFWRTNA